MIATLSILLAVAGGAGFDVVAAPDQPLRQVYVGEPLILSFQASENLEGTCSVVFEDRNGKQWAPEPELLFLRQGAPVWRSYRNLATEAGPYRALVTAGFGESPTIVETHFCRIERPASEPLPFLTIDLQESSRELALAMAGVPLRQCRVDLEAATRDRHLDYVEKNCGNIVAAVTPNTDLSGLDQEVLDRVVRWSVGGTSLPEAKMERADAVERLNAQASLTFEIRSPEELAGLIRAGATRRTHRFTVRGVPASRSGIDGFRAQAELLGHEGIILNMQAEDISPGNGPQLIRHLLFYAAMDIEHVIVPDNLVYHAAHTDDGYGYLNALTHLLGEARFVGELTTVPTVHSYVFRDGAQWTVTLWSTEGDDELVLDLHTAQDLVFTDELGNTRPLREADGGGVALGVAEYPRFLRGKGGPLLGDAALKMVQAEARRLMALEGLTALLPEEFEEVLEDYAQKNLSEYQRLDFFSLLRMFPYLEQEWADQRVTREVAGPALAGLARLALHACLAEQERGAVFIEPYQDTLAKCGRYQSRYLTGLGANRQRHWRGEWLLAEVDRLMRRAELLAEEGRTIEASATAALAEWRARALQHATHDGPVTEAAQVWDEETPIEQPQQNNVQEEAAQ